MDNWKKMNVVGMNIFMRIEEAHRLTEKFTKYLKHKERVMGNGWSTWRFYKNLRGRLPEFIHEKLFKEEKMGDKKNNKKEEAKI